MLSPRRGDDMCNLYSVRTGKDEIRKLARAMGEMLDTVGNFEPLPAIYPNHLAPVVRHLPGGKCELTMMRWGFPPSTIPGTKSRNPYLTNMRNTNSGYWLPYLKKVEHRCLVPVTSFAEPDNNQGPRSIWTWFARDETRPLMFFAGIWREWEGDRGTVANPVPGKHLVFSFLTTDASPDVALIHPDATPVLLLDREAREKWMNAPWGIARELQKPPPACTLMVVRRGAKEDGRGL
jgi:putative SOS response-associated peptidase YedK